MWKLKSRLPMMVHPGTIPIAAGIALFPTQVPLQVWEIAHTKNRKMAQVRAAQSR
jgi:hypothetical protein